MLTPAFEITQDDSHIYIVVNAPYSKVSEADVFVDGEDFKFYAKPYFLRLKLPGHLTEDDRATCHYDVDNGKYKLKIAKENRGEVFKDLDMLTKLLAPTGGRELKQPLIEVLGEGGAEEEQTEVFDWYFSQLCDVEMSSTSVVDNGYGFANQKSGIFGKLQEDLQGVVEIGNLENSTPKSRLQEKLEIENSKFDPEHYLADFFEDEEILRLSKIKPQWKVSLESLEFTDDEKFILKNLPNREYLLDKHQLQAVYLGLVDILFGYAHNWRYTEGENNTESAWCIRTLSATLSCCTCCTNVKETMVFSYRRALIFPFYRNWKFAKACHRDVVDILLQGKKFVLKCLLEIYKLFGESDPYYVTNDLYIRDYCIWIQKANDVAIKSLAKFLKDLKLEKRDVMLDLLELENIGRCVLEKEEASIVENDAASDEIVAAVADLKL